MTKAELLKKLQAKTAAKKKDGEVVAAPVAAVAAVVEEKVGEVPAPVAVAEGDMGAMMKAIMEKLDQLSEGMAMMIEGTKCGEAELEKDPEEANVEDKGDDEVAASTDDNQQAFNEDDKSDEEMEEELQKTMAELEQLSEGQQ